LPTINIVLPSLLAHCSNGKIRLSVNGNTLKQTLENLLLAYPLLKVHLYEESGKQRPYVLIYLNENNIQWFDNMDIDLKPGDQIQIVQSVAGG
jgi:sulfur-carrier protein